MSRFVCPGVYLIRCKNGRVYVGSARNIDARWRLHRSQLRRGTHQNPYLQNTWNCHGEHAFVFGVIEVTGDDPETMRSRENHWIQHFRRALGEKQVFNCGSADASNRGRSGDMFTRSAISRALKGNRNGVGYSYCGRLEEMDVRVILAAYAQGEPVESIAAQHKVHRVHVIRIMQRKVWSHVRLDEETESAISLRASRSKLGGVRKFSSVRDKLTPETVALIKTELIGGKHGCVARIARKYGVTPAHVSHIRNGRVWSHVQPDSLIDT